MGKASKRQQKKAKAKAKTKTKAKTNQSPPVGILDMPSNVILLFMLQLPLGSLYDFAGTCIALRSIFMENAWEVISAALCKSVKNDNFVQFFPFEGFGQNEVGDTTSQENRLVNQPIAKRHNPHLRMMVHAEKILSVHAAVMFWANNIHQSEDHDQVLGHNCATENLRRPICNETYRVLVFHAQNEIYGLRRCLRQFIFCEELSTDCSKDLFFEQGTPLPHNWWIDHVLAQQVTLPFGHSVGFTREQVFAVQREESFQNRRMVISKLMLRLLDVTPARHVREYQRENLWYNKLITSGLIFMQLIPLTWSFDSMLSKDCSEEDLKDCGYEYLRPRALQAWSEANDIADTLKINLHDW